MLNLTRLHLGIAHESQFQGLGISQSSSGASLARPLTFTSATLRTSLMPFSRRSSARWAEAIALSYAVSEHFTSKFAQRERAAIPELALSCLCRRKHSRFLGLAKKCASGSTRADDANTGWWRRCPELARTGLRP